MVQRSRHSGAAGAVLVLLTLLGLLGMHGLPDAMATSGHATAMPTGMSVGMLAGVHGDDTMPAIASTVHHSSSAVHHASPVGPARYTGGAYRHGRPAAVGSPQRVMASAMAVNATSCGMDHAGCLAVLRAAAQLRGLAQALLAVPVPDLSPGPRLATPGRGLRAPPDVSLTGLGISRT